MPGRSGRSAGRPATNGSEQEGGTDRHDHDRNIRALLERAAGGDRQAIGEAVAACYPDVRRIVMKATGDTLAAEDLAHDAIVELIGSIGRFRGRSTFSTFLYRVVINVVNSYWRSRYREAGRQARLLSEADTLASRPDGTLERLLSEERTREVYRITNDLPARLREAFVLCELEGVPGPEAALALGIPENTLWTRLHRARAAFRKAASASLVFREGTGDGGDG